MRDSFPGGGWQPQVAGGGKMAKRSAGAKVQIGAMLLCKSAKAGGKSFQVSGLGGREPGAGVRVRVQVQNLNLTRHPWMTGPVIPSRGILGQHVVLPLP